MQRANKRSSLTILSTRLLVYSSTIYEILQNFVDTFFLTSLNIAQKVKKFKTLTSVKKNLGSLTKIFGKQRKFFLLQRKFSGERSQKKGGSYALL